MEKKKDYYIPLIKKVNWRIPSHQQGANSNKDTSKSKEELELDKEAAVAIMKGQFTMIFRGVGSITFTKL